MSAPGEVTLSAGRVVLAALLPTLLCVAAAYDVKWRRIPNLLTGTVALFGVFAGVSGFGAVTLSAGVLAATVACAIGVLCQLLRVMGGGDVKLFAAVALWLGPSGIAHAALATAVAGGILGLVFLRRSKRGSTASADVGSDRMSRRLSARLQLDDGSDAERVPYGVAIAAGSMWVWWEMIVSRGGLR